MPKELSTEAQGLEPGTYKHYKGNYYEVFGVAHHSETDEELVVYQSVADEGLWVRPLGMFLETVDVDGKQVKRFEPVNE